jgi:DNA-binding NtrC family response regulator
MGRILLVDDEKNFCAVLRQILKIKGHEVDVCGTVADALESIENNKFDLVVSDIRMQPLSGLFLLQELQSNKPELPVVMMTAYASVDTALDALKMGAFDYLTKPFKVEDFMEVVDRALMGNNEIVSAAEMDSIVKDNSSFGCLICLSANIKESCRMVELVAPTDTSVLLQGEGGTGRTLFAQAIHNISSRKDKACIVYSCSDLDPDDDIAVNSLIGTAVDVEDVNSKGAGILGAEGGTLILEDVECLSILMQKMLLDVICNKQLQTGDFKSDVVPVNVRLLVTSSSCLKTAVSEGRFLEELYRRISLISINICPLSERRDDILPLAWFFLKKQVNGDIPAISADVRGALQHYAWPGNVAELKDVVTYLREHAIDGAIVRDSLPPHLLSTIKDTKGIDKESLADSKAKTLKAYLARKGVDLDQAEESQ